MKKGFFFCVLDTQHAHCGRSRCWNVVLYRFRIRAFHFSKGDQILWGSVCSFTARLHRMCLNAAHRLWLVLKWKKENVFVMKLINLVDCNKFVLLRLRFISLDLVLYSFYWLGGCELDNKYILDEVFLLNKNIFQH